MLSCRRGCFAVAGFSFLLVEMASSAGPGRTAPGLLSSALLLLVLTGLTGPVCAVSEPGKWILDVDSVSFLSVTLDVVFVGFSVG